RVLQTGPDVRVLATSREGLGIPGEQLWPLRSLTTPSATDALDVVANSDAVRLFVDRARAVDPAFVLNLHDAAPVGEICRRFDVLDALGELVAKSMLGAVHQGGVTRYQLLETLRQYALEQLEGRDETDAFRRRHADYYPAFAERIGPLLLGAEELAWRPRLK